MKRLSLLSASLSALLLTAPAWADIYHFGYATETNTLPAGASEVELWNTAGIGRAQYYYSLDQRAEFETGLTDRLQASFYLNWNKTTTGDSSAFDWQGFSTEFKYRLLDGNVDPVGFALYSELGFDTDHMELEGKALFDKDIDSWILVGNVIGEADFANRNGSLTEIEQENVLGAAYAFTPRFTAGLEFRNHNDLEKNADTNNSLKWMNSALFLGPSISYTGKAWSLTFTLLPQLPAPKTETGTVLELHDHEAVDARLHLAFHF